MRSKLSLSPYAFQSPKEEEIQHIYISIGVEYRKNLLTTKKAIHSFEHTAFCFGGGGWANSFVS
jgi:hypothetical protein